MRLVKFWLLAGAGIAADGADGGRTRHVAIARHTLELLSDEELDARVARLTCG